MYKPTLRYDSAESEVYLLSDSEWAVVQVIGKSRGPTSNPGRPDSEGRSGCTVRDLRAQRTLSPFDGDDSEDLLRDS